jgi:hypothetical protein
MTRPDARGSIRSEQNALHFCCRSRRQLLCCAYYADLAAVISVDESRSILTLHNSAVAEARRQVASLACSSRRVKRLEARRCIHP